jgi:hypothetical protein
MKKTRCIFFLGLVLSSCFGKKDNPVEPYYTMYEPIFMHRLELEKSVKLKEPQNIKETGKIYIWENFLFINEPFKGIHVFDNTNTEAPVALGFIKIIGNIDIAIKNGFLLADNATDLISIDLKDINNIVVVNRIRNTFPEMLPPDNFFLPKTFDINNRPDSLVIVDWKLRN